MMMRMTKAKRTSVLEMEFRAEEREDKKFIVGYFITFSQETRLFGNVYEEIAPGSVTESLRDNDIRCLFNHDTSKILGRTGNGTLTLRADGKGLYGEAEINDADPEALAIYARIQRGDINACSFGFYPVKETEEIRDDGSVKFTVEEMDLIEVSAVTFPAYPQTEVAARESDVKRLMQERVKTKKAKLKERFKHA